MFRYTPHVGKNQGLRIAGSGNSLRCHPLSPEHTWPALVQTELVEPMKAKKPLTFAIALLVLGSIFLSFGLYLCFKPELYRATCQIQADREIFSPLGETNGSHDPYFIQTEFEVIQSEIILNQVIKALNLDAEWAHKLGHSEKMTTSQCRMLVRRQMELSAIPNTSLIGISICNEEKLEAAKMANAIAEAFRDFRLTQHKEQNLATIKAQETQLKEVKEKIKSVEESLAQITKEPEPGVKAVVSAVHYEQPDGQAQAAYLKEEKLLDKLMLMTAEDLRIAIPAIVPDEILARLLQERTSAETQLIALRQELEETDPDLQRATLVVANLDSQIDDRIQGILQGMQARVASLKAAAENAEVKTEEIKSGITNLPNKKETSISHQQIRLGYELRELQHTRDVLELRLAKLPVAEGPRVEIIRRAEPPPHPVFPYHAAGIILFLAAIITDGAGVRLLQRNIGRKIQPSTK